MHNVEHTLRQHCANIDLLLERSTRELQRLALLYQRHGFDKEAREVNSTVSRIRKQIGTLPPSNELI